MYSLFNNLSSSNIIKLLKSTVNLSCSFLRDQQRRKKKTNFSFTFLFVCLHLRTVIQNRSFTYSFLLTFKLNSIPLSIYMHVHFLCVPAPSFDLILRNEAFNGILGHIITKINRNVVFCNFGGVTFHTFC